MHSLKKGLSQQKQGGETDDSMRRPPPSPRVCVERTTPTLATHTQPLHGEKTCLHEHKGDQMHNACKEKNVPIRARMLSCPCASCCASEQMETLRAKEQNHFVFLLCVFFDLFWCVGFLGVVQTPSSPGAYIQNSVGHSPHSCLSPACHHCMHAVISLNSVVMLPQRSEPLGPVMHLAEDIELALLLSGGL
jgi:hypothetical protein